jgi:hypothetical protein
VSFYLLLTFFSRLIYSKYAKKTYGFVTECRRINVHNDILTHVWNSGQAIIHMYQIQPILDDKIDGRSVKDCNNI